MLNDTHAVALHESSHQPHSAVGAPLAAVLVDMCLEDSSPAILAFFEVPPFLVVQASFNSAEEF